MIGANSVVPAQAREVFKRLMGDQVTIGHYTTLTVDEYNHLSVTILTLRKQLQTVRELLEKGLMGEALEMLRREVVE